MIQSANAALGAAPVLFAIACPSLNKNNAGIPLTPICAGEFGFSSTLIFTIFTFPSYSSDNSLDAIQHLDDSIDGS